MKTKLLAMMLLAGGAMFAQTRVSIGVGFGGRGAGFYQAPLSYASNIPPCPGPGYTWVSGYWYRQPYSSGYQVAPRFDNRFRDGDDRRGFARTEDRNRGFDQGRNLSGREGDQHGDRGRSNGRDNHEGNR